MWRYSRIDELDLDRFHPVTPTVAEADGANGAHLPQGLDALADIFGPRSAIAMTVDGRLALETSTERARIRPVSLLEGGGGGVQLGSVAGDREFTLLNEAFCPDPLLVDIEPDTEMGDPVVIIHVVGGGDGEATFPRTYVRAGEGSRAAVVEAVVDARSGTTTLSRAVGAGPPSARPAPAEHRPDNLVVPVTEVEVANGASLSFVSVQALGAGAWVLGGHASTIGADATLRSFAVALGGGYARLRTDSALAGESGSSVLRAAFVGRDDQMLDFRTLQDHLAPRTMSDLLFMGAVADRSHSVYSGMIRVRRGAVRADAMQTNHNLVLDEGAHADSVPNLDIEENDVRCSHGSTVGPVDEDQRYYLESRGVPPDVAERLIVAGFFADIAAQVPIGTVRPVVARELAARTGAHGE